ncbi:MAG: hypothetical protein H6587_12785 [Flavobacteriales bacterium]|nr:hypothetical protein [Flavobacteriales bacterium]
MLNLDILTKRLLIISLIWIVIDGVFRKWVFPQWSTPIFAVKYLLFSLTYLLFLAKTNFRLPYLKKSYQLFIVLLFLWCFLSFVNPSYKTSWLVKLFGLINYVFFIPLLLIVPHYFNSTNFFEKTIRFLAYLSIPIYIVGIIQYFLPVDHILNYLPNEEQKYNRVAEYTRALSIFSFVKIYNVYLLFTTTLFFSYIYYLYQKNRSVVFYVVLLFLGVLNQFMSGSRLPLALMFLFFLFITAFLFVKVPILRKNVIVSIIVGIILTTILYNVSDTFNTAISAFLKRAEIVEQVAEKGREGYGARDRTLNRINLFKYANEAGWLGFGIGTTYQGTGMVLSNYRTDLPFEEEGERIVLELGIIGGILLILLRWSIFLFALLTFLNTKIVSIALLKIALLLAILPPIFFLNNTTFNYFDGFSYWFSFALILALNHIEKRQLNEN